MDFVLKPGDIVAGKYQIIDALGVGGSGAVYRAQKIGMKLRVALKMMHAEHPDGDVERQRFQREAELVKKLQHPHIVRLMDYGHDESGVPYLAFALLEGMPLEDKIKNEGALNPMQVGRFSQQVLRALDKAHSLDVVHRDIKPANIFLSKGVLGEVVQMLDFGLAKIVHDAPGAMDVTRAGSVLGTPRYMAPEQVRGDKVGPTADIYAFGLVMCEMLTGKPLVEGNQDIDLYVKQGSDHEHVLPAEILDSPFRAIVQRAVAKPLEVRYRQASQMLADVNAVVDALTGGEEVMSEADMEATFVMDPSKLLALSTPTASSAKLRKAFNAMADKQRADANKARKKQDSRPPTSSGGAANASASASQSPPRSTPPPSSSHAPKIVVNAPLSTTNPVLSQPPLEHPGGQAEAAGLPMTPRPANYALNTTLNSEAEQSGRHAAQSGRHAAQSGGYAAQSGGYAVQSGGYAAQSGAHAAQSGAHAAQSGAHAAQSGGHAMVPGAGIPGAGIPGTGIPGTGANVPQVSVGSSRRTTLIIAITCMVVAIAGGLLVWLVVLPRI